MNEIILTKLPRVIDDEVESLISEAAKRASEVIKANRKYLDILKDKLIEKETVEADEVLKLLEGISSSKKRQLVLKIKIYARSSSISNYNIV